MNFHIIIFNKSNILKRGLNNLLRVKNLPLDIEHLEIMFYDLVLWYDSSLIYGNCFCIVYLDKIFLLMLIHEDKGDMNLCSNCFCVPTVWNVSRHLTLRGIMFQFLHAVHCSKYNIFVTFLKPKHGYSSILLCTYSPS